MKATTALVAGDGYCLAKGMVEALLPNHATTSA
jgi:hypothetical protein